jgi:hypothetical protein
MKNMEKSCSFKIGRVGSTGQVDTIDRRLSTRIKKLPVNRSSDFYREKRFKIC